MRSPNDFSFRCECCAKKMDCKYNKRYIQERIDRCPTYEPDDLHKKEERI